MKPGKSLLGFENEMSLEDSCMAGWLPVDGILENDWLWALNHHPWGDVGHFECAPEE